MDVLKKIEYENLLLKEHITVILQSAYLEGKIDSVPRCFD